MLGLDFFFFFFLHEAKRVASIDLFTFENIQMIIIEVIRKLVSSMIMSSETLGT